MFCSEVDPEGLKKHTQIKRTRSSDGYKLDCMDYGFACGAYNIQSIPQMWYLSDLNPALYITVRRVRPSFSCQGTCDTFLDQMMKIIKEYKINKTL